MLQTALKLSDPILKTNLINLILTNLNKIPDIKIVLKWKSIVEEHMYSVYSTINRNIGLRNINNLSTNNIPMIISRGKNNFNKKN